MKQKGFKIIILLFVIAFIIDLISTIIYWEYIPLLEANPLYKYCGLTGIAILHLIFAYCFWRCYKAKTNTKFILNARFISMYFMSAAIILKITAAYNNIHLFQTVPMTMELAQQVTEQMKVQVFQNMLLSQVAPFLIGLLTWICFQFPKLSIRRGASKY